MDKKPGVQDARAEAAHGVRVVEWRAIEGFGHTQPENASHAICQVLRLMKPDRMLSDKLRTEQVWLRRRVECYLEF
jgi:hypothetical protein